MNQDLQVPNKVEVENVTLVIFFDILKIQTHCLEISENSVYGLSGSRPTTRGQVKLIASLREVQI